MRCFKLIRAIAIVGLFFFITPNSTASDTSSLSQATQYVTSVSNFPLQSLNATDTYLGGSFQVGWWSDAWDAVSNGVSNAWNSMTSAFSNAGNALKDTWQTTVNSLTSVSEDADDILATAGTVTGNYIADNPEQMGMIAGAVVLVVITGGTASPAAAGLLGGGGFLGTIGSATAFGASVYGWYQAQLKARDIVFAIKDGDFKTAGILSAELLGDITGVGLLSNTTANITIAQDLINAVKDGDFEDAAKLTAQLGASAAVPSLFNNATVGANLVEAVREGDYKAAAAYAANLQVNSNRAAAGLDALSYVSQIQGWAKEVEAEAAAPTPANKASLISVATQMQQTVSAQLQTLINNFPAGSSADNIAQGTAMINAAVQQGLSATASSNLSQWLMQNNSTQSVVFLGAALDFNQYYTAAQSGNAAAQTAYNKYVANLSPADIGTLMGFVSDNKMNPANTTLLSNQALFLIDPYQFYLAEQADAEQSNVQTVSASGVTASSQVTVKIPSNYAASQMAQLMAVLTPTQRKDVLNSFYGSALTLGNTTAVTTFNQYVATDGTILNSTPATTQSMTAQASADSTTANVKVIATQITAAQQAQTGYDYSRYSDANDATLLQVESSIPPVGSDITADNIQTQIATSSLSDTAKQNLSSWVLGNTSDPYAVNTAAATLQYAQLFNAAYGSGISNNTAALQAFASYFNTLPHATAVAMTNFAVQQGLVSSQNALMITNPAQYLVNQMNAANANNIAFNRMYSGVNARRGPPTAAQTSALIIQYKVNSQQYAMAQLYNATQYWSQAQLKALGSQAYYGSLLNNNGLTSILQTYLTPAGTYQNNPQGIMAAQQAQAARSSISLPQITPAGLQAALQSMTPAAAQSWISSYQMIQSSYQRRLQIAQQTGNYFPGYSNPFPNLYSAAIAQYQASQQPQSLSLGQAQQQQPQQHTQQQQMQQLSDNTNTAGSQAVMGFAP